MNYLIKSLNNMSSGFQNLNNHGLKPTPVKSKVIHFPEKRTSNTLVSPKWLRNKLNEQKTFIIEGGSFSLGDNTTKIQIIDATWSLEKPNYPEDFLSSHIPGSVFFDINQICNKNTDLPHMLPNVTDFSKSLSELGISNDDHLVIYDRSGIFLASARVWWTFRVFGHPLDKLSILDGGLEKWKYENGPVENGAIKILQTGNYEAKFQKELVQDLGQMLENVEKKSQIVDARSHKRYTGEDPEPRPVRGGHMPGSRSVPFTSLLMRENDLLPWCTFKPDDAIVQKFHEVGINPQLPTIATCGSGITASVLALALHLIGNDKCSVYDGSWAEWGKHDLSTPVIKGEAIYL